MKKILPFSSLQGTISTAKNNFKIWILAFTLLVSFSGYTQTVISNETFPNQFNSSFGTTNNSNGTFVGSAGTWTSSCNNTALSAIAVIPAYYSAVTNAIKIVNWNTSGKGAADCHAASPTINLSNYVCAQSLNLTFQLYTYTCTSADATSFFKVEFSADNGTTWTSVWSMSSAQIFAAYGANGLTGISVPVSAAYRVSGFRYRFSGYKPSNEPNNFYLFVDDAKLTATACVTACTAKVTNLYFNKLDGGTDLTITNGSTFTVAQLGSLYNMEAGTTGTVGSVKYTITGPTPTSNIENTAPYNSPGTGTGAWTGAVGTYNVNLKTYSAADGTGILCHDTTITFNLSNTTNNCSCPGTNVVLNPSFESGITSWLFAGGSLAAGTGGVACGNYSGDLNNTSTSSKAWQTIGTDLAIGTSINVSVYAGTHDNTFNNYVAIEFLDAANVVLGTSVYTQVDKVLASAPVGPQSYTLTATVPNGAKYTRVAFGGTGSYTKTDQWCASLTPPVNTGSIGDRVWLDADGDGLQDASETGGITGVTVQLKNSAGTVIATTTTNATGNYLFSNLPAGNYTVVFPASISGAVVTGQNVGGDDNIDSDANQTTGATGTITLAAGQNITNVDAGYCPTTLQLGNRVWYDANNDGLNGSENGIANATVNLYKDDNNDNVADGASIATLTTDANGYYSFNNLGPGNYIVGVIVPNGYMSSSVNGGDPDNNINLDDNGQVLVGNEVRGLAITLVAGTEPDGTNTNTNNNVTYDFGFYLSCIGQASGFGILGLNNGTFTINSGNTLNANVGYSRGVVSGTNQKVTTFVGTSYVHSLVSNFTYTAATYNPSGGIVQNNPSADAMLDEANASALSASSNYAALMPNVALGDVTTNQTINRVNNITVVSMSSLNYNSNTITFVGQAGQDDAFIINVAGSFDFSQSTVVLTNVRPERIVWNFPNASNILVNKASTIFKGTILAPTGSVIYHNPASFEGAIIAKNIAVHSDFNLTQRGLDIPCTSSGTLTLGNRVWYDTDNDGINDAGENGIRNVTVRLYTDADNDNVADGPSIATTTTDANGYYTFAGLTGGNYLVGVVIPAGYMSSAVNGGDPDNNTDLDDNGQVLSGNEVRGFGITLASGTEPGGNTNNTYDFGLLPDCGCTTSANNLLVNGSFENGTTGWTWSGGTLTTGTGYIACGAANGFNNWSAGAGTAKVWQDVNVVAGSTVTFNAFAGTHTPGIACAPKLSLIFLNASNVIIGQTDVTVTRDVDVNFSQLEQYSITAIAPAGTVKARVQSSITCNTMKMDAFCLTSVPPTGSIGDRIWKDDNGNGIQDAGEVGLAGVTVVILNSAGVVVATTTTDALGNYLFSKLPADTYTLRITPPANYSLSAKTQGGNTALDNDFDPITYTTGPVVLTAGQNRTDIDAGLKFIQNVGTSVGDRVWLDTNSDGIQDAGEPGVSNVLVTLYNTVGAPVASTYTDANGKYLFTGVAPGTYTVGVSLPPAFVFSPNNGALSLTNNSDINPANGRTASFTVNAGDQITYVDAGLRTQVATNGSVGDFVWNDLNKDGVQNAGEPGIAGVTVRLVNATTNTIVATTTTDANGEYIFNDVVPGNYLVDFVTPAGYTITTRINTNPVADVTDSDVNPATSRTGTFSLGAGQRISSVDAGYWVTTPPGTAKLGDRVWLDGNQNGIQDAGEPGVAGITVTLYDAGNFAIKQAVTDQNGLYIFTDLAAGNYTVGFSNLPAGYTFTTQGAGTAATGSDANPVTGKTATIALGAGQINLDIDAGIRSSMAGTASIGNKVFYDLNNNGLQDAGELGIQGITVELLDAAGNPIDKDPSTPGIQPTVTTTNALGEYLFTGLPAGDYRVRFSTLPAGYNAVTKGVGADRNLDSDGNPIVGGTSTTDVISVAAGDERLDIDLGLFNPTAPLGQLGDRVFFDANNNGIQDATEQGVPGVSVALLDASGNVIRTTVTDGDGIYKFVNLADATYSVQFSNLPAGFTFSGKDLGGNDALDSDADPVTGKTGTYVISGGNTNLTVDAGIYSTKAALGDYVWLDINKDGIQDATESGIPGVTVTLYDAGNVAVASTVTDQNGKYFFSNLNAGNYTVGFTTIPSQLVFTAQDVVAAGDAADSDVNPATGKTGTVTLVAGQVNRTVDAGLKPYVPASIGDFVWHDLDRDGIQDAGEPGVAGIVVTLYNSANQPIGSAITDGNGYYNITNVPPGTGYYVQFSNKPNVTDTWTLQNVGGAGAVNNSKVNATGQTATFTVAEGQNITNIDAGLIKQINVSGNVWHDVNGMSDGFVNNSGALTTPPSQQIPANLFAFLVDDVTGLVVAAEGVDPFTGKFTFENVAPNKEYYVVISRFYVDPGFPPPVSALPAGWQNTGQNLGLDPGNDGLNDAKLYITVETSDVINVNFGIRLAGRDIVIG